MCAYHLQERYIRRVGAFLVLQLAVLTAVIASSVFWPQLSAARGAESEDETLAFDIPAQSLVRALRMYGAATGVQLFYQSELVDGRTSAPVQGLFSPNVALQILLRGTQLRAVSFDPGTETLVAAPRQVVGSVDLQRLRARAVAFQSYFALVQSGLRSALCRAPETRLSGSEIRVELWIAASGAVRRANLLSSTGSLTSDRAYIAALRTLSIGPPPPAMPRPITLLILPRQSSTAAECESLDQALRHD